MAKVKLPFNPLLALLAVLATLFFVFPLIGLIAGAPWGHIGSRDHQRDRGAGARAVASSPRWRAPRSRWPSGSRWPGCWRAGGSLARELVRGLTTLPMVLPPVVGGIALLLAYGRRGFIGRPLESASGSRCRSPWPASIVAETFVAMPFFVITVESGLRSMNRRLEDAARSLGAPRWTVFLRVTLPLIWPSLAAGAVLTWARALGEFGATITFAGNLPGVTQTMPLAIYISQSSNQTDEAIALSLILVVVSLVVMIFRRDRSGAG